MASISNIDRASNKTAEQMADLMPWHYCHFGPHGISYQACRFCHQGCGEVEGLWKYGVRHYVCTECRDAITSRGTK